MSPFIRKLTLQNQVMGRVLAESIILLDGKMHYRISSRKKTWTSME